MQKKDILPVHDVSRVRMGRRRSDLKRVYGVAHRTVEQLTPEDWKTIENNENWIAEWSCEKLT